MQSQREKYEMLILASPLFSFDRQKERTAYLREARRMVEYLYLYLMAINEDRYGEYGLEITETARRCIEGYRPETGSFLSYFNAAMKKEYLRASGRQSLKNARGGMHVTEEDDRNLKRMLRLMQSKGITHPTEEQISLLAEVLDLPEERIREYLMLANGSAVLSETSVGGEGEELSLFDTLAADTEADTALLREDECRTLLRKVETAFCDCQERQKPMLRTALTVKLAPTLCEYGISAEGLTYIEPSILKNYLKGGTLPTQRQIADSFGVNEASLSRTLKNFLKKIDGV